MKKGMSRGKIIAASIIGCVLTLQMGAFSVTLETLASGITELPFTVFVMAMQPIHLAIGLVEGIITAAVLVFIYEARPSLLWCYGENAQEKNAKLSFKHTVAVLAAAAFVIAGLVSLVASTNPDGLEWSLQQITGSTELEAEGTVYENAAKIQETISILPDYAFKNSESAAGTSVSGIAGAVVVLLVCAFGCFCFRFFRRKKQNE